MLYQHLLSKENVKPHKLPVQWPNPDQENSFVSLSLWQDYK